MLAPAYFSIDVETAGPHPGSYALLSIGACAVSDLSRTFYVELQPDHLEMTDSAFRTHGLSLEELTETGRPPAEAMADFERWLLATAPPGTQPVMVALNAPFDWSFINEYFHRYLGRNPFGHSALDIKALFMGVQGMSWEQTGYRHISRHFGIERSLQHQALQDALDQAALFNEILKEIDHAGQIEPGS